MFRQILSSSDATGFYEHSDRLKSMIMKVNSGKALDEVLLFLFYLGKKKVWYAAGWGQ